MCAIRGANPWSALLYLEVKMKTKKCSMCKEYKNVSEFFVNKYNKFGNPIYSSVCKKCHCKREKDRYVEKMKLIDSLKTPCLKCGEKRIRCICYHHLDPKEKDFTIAQLRKTNKDVIVNEIKKCICLCLNCHHEFHYLERKEDITIEKYINNAD